MRLTKNTTLIARGHRLTLCLLMLIAAIVVATLTPICIPVARAAASTVACGDIAGLITAISNANTDGQADTIDLASGCTYTLTAVNNGSGGNENGLPIVQPDGGNLLTNKGNGATIARSATAPNFRILEVTGDAGL